MDFATGTIGRYLFALPFALFGLGHFANASTLAARVPVPPAVFWVYLTGAALIVAAVSIAWGRYARSACQLLGVLMLVFAFTVHLPAMIGGDPFAMSQVLKDVSLAGGAWILADCFPTDLGTGSAASHPLREAR